MDATLLADPYLEDFVAKYDRWIEEGKVPHAARIIPVAESLEARPWVMPTEQVLEILRGARSLAVWPCVCRTHYQRCDNPVEVCLLLDQPAEALVARGAARTVTLEEAAGLLQLAAVHGLSAVCSCCTCCCHELQILQKLGRRDRLARSEYAAVTDPEACTHCGACVDRCAFGARAMAEGRLQYRAEDCMGCGLCVTVCGATRMEVTG